MNIHRPSTNIRDVIGFAFLTAMGFILATQLDRLVYNACDLSGIKETDVLRTFRVMGFAPFWLLVAIALALVDSARARTEGWRVALRRTWLLVMSVAISGAISEILKLLIRRERPSMHDGASHFAPWSEFKLDSGKLATPSGHAMVAFAAAWILCRLFPRATPVWLVLAVGCATTRVMSRQHFVSDVYLSAVISFAVVWLIWRRHLAKTSPAASAP